MEEGAELRENTGVSNRPRLYFHGTTVAEAPTLFSEHGLAADKWTLTPFLEVTLNYLSSDQSFLSFWYPKGIEIEKPTHRITQPTKPISEEFRKQTMQQIENSKLDEETKQNALKMFKWAKTHLPSSRLGAIAKVTKESVRDLSGFLREQDIELLEDYAHYKEDLVEAVKGNLDQLEIEYFDPELNNKRLAEDMAKTAVEHYMLSVGLELRITQAAKPDILQKRLPTIQRYLGSFQKVHFQEPVLERYRQQLISRMDKLMNRDSAAPEVESK